MTDATPTLDLTGVTKCIDGRAILAGCSITLYPGEICAIIGPNGAGKTTLFKLIAGLAFPSSGTIAVTGRMFDNGSRDALLARIGASIEAPEFRNGATAEQVLQLHFDLLGLSDHQPIDELFALVGLTAAARSPVASFSLGMKQHLALARAISHRPTLLVLDEPANGLDPTGISDLRDLITSLAVEGMTVLMASHVLTEIEQTAHTVAVLTDGYLGVKQDVTSILDANGGSLEEFYSSSVAEARR
ncbi:ATP-binding cassette domain-containing protein [Devriesea agamarum]|uniref:ATP-binding cassette domain-containing protein n=1 Tax=Devriesea agamarum TaxID=472569 RepID=UPI00071CFE8C|nr:ATP-binding cassette domain-containing protein [Devriesea agamarum]